MGWKDAPVVQPPKKAKWEEAQVVSPAQSATPAPVAAPAQPTVSGMTAPSAESMMMESFQSSPFLAKPRGVPNLPDTIGGLTLSDKVGGNMGPNGAMIASGGQFVTEATPEELAANKAKYEANQKLKEMAQPTPNALQTGILGAGQSFGVGDEIGGLIDFLIPGGRGYAEGRDKIRDAWAKGSEENPVAGIAGQIGGAIVPSGLMAKGLGLTAKGLPLIQRVLGGAGLGAAEGAAYGFGSGEGGVQNRAENALVQGGLGAALGGAFPVVATMGRKALEGVGNAVTGALGKASTTKAGDIISSLLERAGTTADDAAAKIAADKKLGLPTMLADALGNPGQRALRGQAVIPGGPSDDIAKALTERAAGQSERIIPWLDEALGTGGKTAKATRTGLEAVRRADAGVNYPAADAAAGQVNLTGAIGMIDDLAKRNPILNDTSFTKTEMGKRLAALRGKFTDGKSLLSDYQTVLGLKQDLYATMKNNPTVAAQMKPVYEALDQALEQASVLYRNANDTYATQSRTLGALDIGKLSAGPATRADDTVATFGAMTPDDQAAFRAGYADPLINKVENARGDATGALLTPGMKKELATLAQNPDDLLRRLEAERTMAQTKNMALGGSPTAEKLMDAGDVANTVSGLVTSPIKTIGGAILRGLSGQNEATRGEVVKALLGNDPRQLLEISQSGLMRNPVVAQIVQSMLRGGERTGVSEAKAQ